MKTPAMQSGRDAEVRNVHVCVCVCVCVRVCARARVCTKWCHGEGVLPLLLCRLKNCMLVCVVERR